MKTQFYLLLLLTGFVSTLSAGPIKDYAIKKKQQFEQLRKNPSTEIQKMLKFKASPSLIQNKPASVLIPDSIVNFVWDGNQYQQMGYEIIQYSAQQKVDFVKFYMQNFLVQTIDFQYPGTPFASTIFVNTNPGASNQPDEKMELFFDSQNKLIKTKSYERVNNAWQLVYADSIHIINNSANPPKPQEIQFYTSESGGPYSLQFSVKNISYDSNTGLEKNLTFAIDLLQIGVPIDLIKYENATWELGHTELRRILYDYESVCNVIYERYTLLDPFEYAIDYGPTSYQLSELNLTTQQMTPTIKLLPTYTGNNLTSILEQNYDGSGWFTTGRQIPTLVNNKLVEIDYESYDGNNYTLSQRIQFHYDSQGNFSGEFQIFYSGTSTDTAGFKYDRTYMGSNLTEEIYKIYDPGMGLQPQNKDLFFYVSSISVGEIASNPERTKIYPNPSTGKTTITFPKEGQWLLTLTDLTGRIVKKLEFMGLTAEVSLTGVPAGNYVVTIQCGTYSEKQKLSVF